MAMKEAAPTAGRRLWRLLSWAKTGTKEKVEDLHVRQKWVGGGHRPAWLTAKVTEKTSHTPESPGFSLTLPTGRRTMP